MGAWLVQRMKAGRDIAVLQKKRWYGGITPFGYTKKKSNPEDPEHHNLLVDVNEAKVYKQIVKWCLEGLGTGKIARRLNDLGIKTNFSLKGRKNQSFLWKQQVVLRILKNRIYKGEFHYKGKKIAVIPIISEKEWNKIQERLKSNSIYSSRNTKRFYLLRGLLKCGNCGRNLFGYIKENRGERVYKCISKRPDPEPRSCGLRSINIEKANRDVWLKVREYILSLEKLKVAIRSQKDTTFVDQLELETQLNLVRKKIAGKDQEISDLLRKKGKFSNISDNEIDHIVGNIKNEKNELIIYENQILGKVQSSQSLESKTREIEEFLSKFSNRVDELSDSEKYDILHTIVNKITVTYDLKLKKHFTNVSLALNPEIAASGFGQKTPVNNLLNLT
jgi:site-specific DNA recombinase